MRPDGIAILAALLGIGSCVGGIASGGNVVLIGFAVCMWVVFLVRGRKQDNEQLEDMREREELGMSDREYADEMTLSDDRFEAKYGHSKRPGYRDGHARNVHRRVADRPVNRKEPDELTPRPEFQGKRTSQASDQGVCGCCGQKFVETTRMRPEAGVAWTGHFLRFSFTGVCPRCHGQWVGLHHHVRPWSIDEWTSWFNEQFRKVTSAEDAEALFEQVVDCCPDLAEKARQKAQELGVLEARTSALIQIRDACRPGELLNLIDGLEKAGLPELVEVAKERLPEVETLAQLDDDLQAATLKKAILAQEFDAIGARSRAALESATFEAPFLEILKECMERADRQRRKEADWRNQGCCRGCGGTLSNYELTTGFCNAHSGLAKDLRSGIDGPLRSQ